MCYGGPTIRNMFKGPLIMRTSHTPWAGPMLFENVISTDGRLVRPGALTWDDTQSFPLRRLDFFGYQALVGYGAVIARAGNAIYGFGNCSDPADAATVPVGAFLDCAETQEWDKAEFLAHHPRAIDLSGDHLDKVLVLTEGRLRSLVITDGPSAFPDARIRFLRQPAQDMHYVEPRHD